MKGLIQWSFNMMISLVENSESLTQEEEKKLNIVFDVIDLLIQQQCQSQDNTKDSQSVPYKNEKGGNFNHQIQSLSGRETRLNHSKDDLNQQIQNDFGYNELQPQIQPLIKQQQVNLAIVELYALINPIIFWLDFSIERPERLPLFKIIWKTLNKILDFFSENTLDINIISIILPVLAKVEQFCTQNSPQIEMLQFLQVVFGDLAHSKVKSRELSLFLDHFLINIVKCIPHNLHEEIFFVCEQVIEMMKDKLKKNHIETIVDALIDKYTMRSKSHKRLMQSFFNTIISQSLIQLEYEQEPVHMQSVIPQQQQVRQQEHSIIGSNDSRRMSQTLQLQQQYIQQPPHQMGTIPAFQQQTLLQDGIDNYEYERESNEYGEEEEDQTEEILQNEFHSNLIEQAMYRNNQEQYNESPISHRLNHEINLVHQNSGGQQVRPSTNLRVNQQTESYIDYFYEITFQNNVLRPFENDKNFNQIQLDLFLEKLGIFQSCIKNFSHNHMYLYVKLLNKTSFKEQMLKFFQNDYSCSIGLDILEQAATFYMKYCAPKNIYEHPIQLIQIASQRQQEQVRQNNNNQNSQSSGYQQQQHHFLNNFTQNVRDSARNSFTSSQNNNNNFQSNLRTQLNSSGQQHLQQHSIPHHQIYRFQEHDNIDNDDLLLDNLNDEVLYNEKDIINRERLILIQIYSQAIRHCIDRFNQTQEIQLQFKTLIMIDNLFSNLMPIPSLQNYLIELCLSRQNQSRQKVHHHEIPDLEKMQIVDSVQTLNQLIQQNSNHPSNAQKSYVLSEFEVHDLKYLHARINFALKIWAFVEQSLVQSSWSNVKSICYGIVCQMLKIRINDFKQSFQSKIKQIILPLLNTLLFSKESEQKAGGLNIIGAFCGLGAEFSHFSHFKINQHMDQFRKNSKHIPLAIWQQVFNLQDDWDYTIRDAASVLIQICAPRDTIRHFNSIVREKYNLKLQQMIRTYNTGANQNIRTKQYIEARSQAQTPSMMINSTVNGGESKEEYQEGMTERVSYHDERRSVFRNYLNSSQSIRMQGLNSNVGQYTQDAQQDDRKSSQSSSDEERKLSGTNGQNLDQQDSYFYVDAYSDSQIKELLGIFKNDYRPPKSLWIEKQQTSNNYEQILDFQDKGYESTNIIDVLEDRIVNQLNGTQSLNDQNKHGQSFQKNDQTGDSEYLIFERHFESDKDKIKGSNIIGNVVIEESNDSGQNLESISQDDLGIIDLDQDEGDDEFDELDDDKLPILKNTYSKKNRPNNSKSVSIGSRTQGMHMTSRQNQLQYTLNKTEDQVQNNDAQVDGSNIVFEEESKQDFIIEPKDTVEKNEDKVKLDDDKLILEFEKKIAQSINDLNEQLNQQSLKSPESKISQDPILSSSSPQISIIATVQVHKRQDNFKSKERVKSNKSFELKYRSSGLQSPIRSKTNNASLITDDITEKQTQKQSANSQTKNENKSIKTLADPSQDNQKKSYSSQASKLKTQSKVVSSHVLLALRKDYQSSSKSHLSQTNQPQSHQSTQKSSSFLQNKILMGSFGSQTSTNIRKRKSDFQRKSEASISSLVKRKAGGSSQSQISKGKTDQSIEKVLNPSITKSQVWNYDTQKGQKPQVQNLMQKAKQAFVQRAKSQSYLNSLTAINSVNQGIDSSSFKRNQGSSKQTNISLSNQTFDVRYNQADKIIQGVKMLKQDRNQKKLLGNSACSVGNLKGYFSNDESDRVNTEGDSRIKTNPPMSGDLHQRNQHSFSSEGEISKARAQSHNLKRKRNNQVLVGEQEQQIQRINLTTENSKHEFGGSQNQIVNSTPNQESDGELFYKSSDFLHTAPPNNLRSPTSEPNSLQFYPKSRYDEKFDEDDQDEDFEEFLSHNDSAKGQMKQLSAIDEEDDITERKRNQGKDPKQQALY